MSKKKRRSSAEFNAKVAFFGFQWNGDLREGKAPAAVGSMRFAAGAVLGLWFAGRVPAYDTRFEGLSF